MRNDDMGQRYGAEAVCVFEKGRSYWIDELRQWASSSLFSKMSMAGVFSKRLLYWFLMVMLLIMNPGIIFAGQYELVRGKQFQLCRDLVKNFNEFKDERPMLCERKFSPKYKDFKKPNWKALDIEQNFPLILAIKRESGAIMLPEHLEKMMSQYEIEVQERIKQGKVFLYEANFDIAHSGEKVRVVMVNDYCDPASLERVLLEDPALTMADPAQPIVVDPAVAIMKPGSLEGDARYKNLSSFRGDVFFFQGRSYLAQWSIFPSAIGRSPGPSKKHNGYILVYEPFWLVQQATAFPRTSAGYNGTLTCQIGYKH